MFRLTRSALRARSARLILSATAVALGVALVTGTLVLTATLQHGYDQIIGGALEGVDAVVRSEETLVASDDSELRAAVDDRAVAAARSATGVAAAEPHVQGIAQLVGDDGRLLDDRPTRATPVALGWTASPALNPLELVTGTAPVGPDDVVVDRATARDAGLDVGDEVGVLTATGSGRYRIAGIATYGGADDAGGADVVAFRFDRATELFGTGGPAAIQVAAAPGVSEAQVSASVRDALARAGVADTEVVTGTSARTEAASAAGTAAAEFGIFLLAFALVSLLVGAFVIANAFSITIAQRARENALLRAIGASRGQVTRAVVAEALLVGLVASAVGVALGIGAALGLRALLAGAGLDLPEGPLVVSGGVVVTGIGLGTVMTLLATYLPARRSGRVAPVAALRDLAVEARRASRARTVVGVVLVGMGAVALVAGLADGGAPLVGLGALAVFTGVVVLGPVVAPTATRVLGAPLRRIAGVTGDLAVENARRNPKRTAATSASLMIGLGLVGFMTIFATSVQASFATSVDDALRGDWIVSTVFGQGGVSPELARSLDELPETGAVSPVRYSVARAGDDDVDVSGVDPTDIAEVVDAEVTAGQLADLGRGGAAVHADVASAHGWDIGDTVTVAFPATGERSLPIVAVYETLDPLGDVAVSLETFDANVVAGADRYVIVANAAGVSGKEAATAMRQVLVDHPTADLQTGAEFAEGVTAEISTMLNLVYALLALAVLIALFGVANTMAMSVHERTREIGLLRAVGMARRQVRAVVRMESVLISLLGTATGLVVGAGFAVAVVDSLRDEGLGHLTVPVPALAVMVVVGVVAGVVAAALPARRAARLDVLTALHAD